MAVICFGIRCKHKVRPRGIRVLESESYRNPAVCIDVENSHELQPDTVEFLSAQGKNSFACDSQQLHVRQIPR